MAPDGAPPAARRRRGWPWLTVLFLLVAIAALWLTGIVGLAAHGIAMVGGETRWQGRSLWFPDYRVGIEAGVIHGLAENASGLTYSTETDTLFTVVNRPPELIEFSTEGRLVRRIALIGASDIEGVTHVDGDRFIVVDEGRARLAWMTITPTTTAIDLDSLPFFNLDLGAFSNMGFEGISWDQRRQELVIVQEMWPVRVLIIGGLERALSGLGLGVTVQEWRPDSWAGHFVTDLSSVTVHDATGNIVLLSHMTSVLAEYSPDGAPISLMPLWRGWHGLQDGVPQAEGVAIGPDGAVYVVSEPNLFYRFDRTASEAAN